MIIVLKYEFVIHIYCLQLTVELQAPTCVKVIKFVKVITQSNPVKRVNILSLLIASVLYRNIVLNSDQKSKKDCL